MSVVAAAAPAVAGIGSTAVSPLISAIMSQSMKRRLSGSGEGGRRGVPRYQPVSRATGMQPFVDWTPQVAQPQPPTSTDPYTRGLQEAVGAPADTARAAALIAQRLAAKKSEEEEAAAAEVEAAP
jgi:hypothetical protein